MHVEQGYQWVGSGWVWAPPKLNSILMGGRIEDLLSTGNISGLDQVGTFTGQVNFFQNQERQR